MEPVETSPEDALAAARRFMATGRFEAADLLVDDLLAAEPGHVDALVLRAGALLARGNVERAFELLGALASRQPGRADIVANLGVVHRLAGRVEEAGFCFERAVALDPEDGAHRAAFATFLLAAGDLDGARAQAEVLLDIGRRRGEPELLARGHGLAARIALPKQGPLAAERLLRQALALRPDDAADLALLSDLLAGLGRRAEALDRAREVYLKAPTDPDAALLLARRLAEMNLWEEAERHLRRIVATAPHHVEAGHLLASRMVLKGEGARAVAAFGDLVRRAPEDVELLARMALLLRLSGALEKALSFAQIAARQAPEAPRVQALREELLLALGRVDEVWPVPREPSSPVAVTVPLGTPAADVVLLARFAARLAPPGGCIPCHAEPELQPLLAGMVGLAPTIEPAPPGAAPLTDLPALLGAAEALPAAPYLAVEAWRDGRWRAALEAFPRPLVGLAWEEDAPGLTLDAVLAALWPRPAGTGTWISLAFDGSRRQLAAHPAIVDAGARFADFRDMAAAIAQLDLVVGVDGLALHAAGAMGREGVVAIPAHQPWAWAPREGRALWYPTIRVARQAAAGRWEDVLDALRSAIAAGAAENRGGEELA